MKEQKLMKDNLIRFALVVTIFVVMFSTPVQAAKLNKTSLKLEKGKTYTLKLNGTKKKAVWKTKDKKIASLSNKRKTSVKIKAVKAGKTTVTAKVGKKTYKCKVTVVNPKKKETSNSKTDTNKKKDEKTNKTTEEKANKTTEDKTKEKTNEKPNQMITKKKVWIITKWGETKYSPIHVNERSQWECTCGFKTENGEEFDEHVSNHLQNEEPSAWKVNTIWDSVNWVTVETPEEGHWTEIEADEYPKGLCWRSDEDAKEYELKDTTTGKITQPATGYWYIDKSVN